MRQCPRVHFKVLASDGASLYVGSANLTGAGLGAKGEGRRNFELGFVTDDELTLDAVQERFDRIWRGAECKSCRLRGECPSPLDGPRLPTEAERGVAHSPGGATTATNGFTRGRSRGSLGRGAESAAEAAENAAPRPTARPRRPP
jgi:hypothetical protein